MKRKRKLARIVPLCLTAVIAATGTLVMDHIVQDGKLSTLAGVYGDVNNDGKVNASDAAVILQYAAWSGAGNEGDLPYFLNQKGTEQPTEDTPQMPVLENMSGFPDLKSFSADTLDGTTWTEAEFAKADVTVINLWATFCMPCIDEMPEIAEFQKTLPSNVQLVTCCINIYEADRRSDAEQILSDAGYQGVTLMNPTGDLQSLIEEMEYVPTTVFVDSEGHILGEAIIGGGYVQKNYTSRINEALRAMGKDTI